MLSGRDVCTLMMMMMHSDVCVDDADDEKGIGWVNLECEILYPLMLGRNIRQRLNRVKMWVPSLISEEYMVRTVING
jgi:hypothetical protein